MVISTIILSHRHILLFFVIIIILECSYTALRGVTYPGTKWCGPGSRASNYSELGYLKDIDKCCRNHDNCFDMFQPLEFKYNLTNTGPFTRLHCDCEDNFRSCLRNIGGLSSAIVGNGYFDIVPTSCFREDFPIVRCLHLCLFPTRCLEYELNITSSKLYQWFDVPLYQKKYYTQNLR